MAIVTADDIAVIRGVTYSQPEKDQLNAIITLIQGELEAYLRCRVEPADYVEAKQVDLYTPQIYLTHRPVTAVSLVKAENTTVDPNYYTVKRYGLDFSGIQVVTGDPIIWTPSSTPYTFGVLQTTDAQSLAIGAHPVGNWTVSYTAGYDGASEPALRGIIMRATLRGLAEMSHGISALYTRMMVEDFSIQVNERLAIQMTGYFTPGDIKLVQDFRRKV